MSIKNRKKHDLEDLQKYMYLLDAGHSFESIHTTYGINTEHLKVLRSIMKNELLYVNHFDSIEDFENELKKYIWWYNNKRIKLRLKGMSPAQYRAHYYKDFNN